MPRTVAHSGAQVRFSRPWPRKNRMSTSDFDEFSFLAAQAADAGIEGPLPRVERLTLALADGRTLSALRYDPQTTASHDGPVVTFLHGAGLNAHTWDTTILALGLPALAIDLPGHGDSSWRDDLAYLARPLAADVAAGMDAWTDRPQLLVGQSLGGLTAAAVAASRADLVRELVIIDITPGIDPSGNATQIRQFFAGPTDWASREELVERALSFGLGGSREAAARGVMLNSRVRQDGRVEWKHHFAHLAAAAAASVEDPATSDSVTTALDDGSGWDDLRGATAPITLIRGDHGYVTEAEAEQFADTVAGAEVRTVIAGHNVQEEMPVELGRSLRDLALHRPRGKE